MSKSMTIGLDLAKHQFHVVCCDRRGKLVKRQQLSRARLLPWFANIEPCLVGMEACASSHYWARELQRLGHEVRLISPQYVKPYLRGNKNDYNDALAIAEAVVRPEMRFVAIKSAAQQDIQAVHRLRERRIQERTGLCNQLRGLLAEYGVILAKGVSTLRKQVPAILEDGENGLSGLFRELLAQGYQQLCELDAHIEAYTRQITTISRQQEACRRLQSIPGFGPIVASAFYSLVGDGSGYRRGRDVSAALGLVPRQHGTGGKPKLGSISKRGDRYLRSLLVQGAWSVLMHADSKDDELSRWVKRIRAKRGFHKAVVALANKLARIGWAVLAEKSCYRPVMGTAA